MPRSPRDARVAFDSIPVFGNTFWESFDFIVVLFAVSPTCPLGVTFSDSRSVLSDCTGWGLLDSWLLDS